MRRILGTFVVVLLILVSVVPAFAKGEQIVKVSTDIEIPKDMVASDVVAIGGNVTVYGKVENSVVAVGGSIILKPGSYVGEQVVVVGGELIRDPEARIGGKATVMTMVVEQRDPMDPDRGSTLTIRGEDGYTLSRRLPAKGVRLDLPR